MGDTDSSGDEFEAVVMMVVVVVSVMMKVVMRG